MEKLCKGEPLPGSLRDRPTIATLSFYCQLGTAFRDLAYFLLIFLQEDRLILVASAI